MTERQNNVIASGSSGGIGSSGSGGIVLNKSDGVISSGSDRINTDYALEPPSDNHNKSSKSNFNGSVSAGLGENPPQPSH